MIVGIDHLVLLCPDIDTGVTAYGNLLGRHADWVSQGPGGYASALFQLDNLALELLAPAGQGPMADRLNARLEREGPGLQTLVLASDNLDADHHRLQRCALLPDEIQDGQSTDRTTGRTRHWRRFRIDDAASHGVRTFVLQRQADDPLLPRAVDLGSTTGIDHLVITTSNADRAAILYGARLGLPMTQDWISPDGGSRLMVFKAGAARLELSQRRSTGEDRQPDHLWGITWQTNDLELAHARLSGSGLDVSDLRTGARRGTRVFTVRNGTLNVPTLMLRKV